MFRPFDNGDDGARESIRRTPAERTSLGLESPHLNPDVVEGIQNLRAKAILSEAQAAPLLRVARRELVSVRHEMQTLLYAGVLAATTGVGLFLKENNERLGPMAIATLLGAAAAACLVYVFRRAPAFSWQRVEAPHVAVDYLLLLGVLLLASDLAYVEAQFRVLGPRWPYHLLLVSLIFLAAAYRFDSRAVLSLALSSFAAWRGVAVTLPFAADPGGSAAAIRANALACGAAFAAIGFLTARAKRKPHFEPVWTTLGLILVFGGALSGVFAGRGSSWALWEAVLFVLAGLVAAAAFGRRRSLDFAIATIAAYLGLLRILSEVFHGRALMLVVAGSSLAVIALLVRSHRRMKEPA